MTKFLCHVNILASLHYQSSTLVEVFKDSPIYNSLYNSIQPGVYHCMDKIYKINKIYKFYKIVRVPVCRQNNISATSLRK